MNIISLDKDARKRFCKCYTLDEFKQLATKNNALSKAVLSALKKQVQSLTKNVLDNYIVRYDTEPDAILTAVTKIVDKKTFLNHYIRKKIKIS